MKYLFKILILILINVSVVVSQNTLNQNFSLTLGKPIFSESSQDAKNFSAGINYQNRFSNSFAFDVFYTYAQVSNLPDYIDDAEQLEQEILGLSGGLNLFFETDWSRIRNHSLGSKIHFLFVNSDTWSFSVFGGFGYNFSSSKQHVLLNTTFDEETLEIISFENEVETENYNSFFGIYGLQTHYNFYKNYLIGFEVSFLSAFTGEDDFDTLNRLPDYYNFNLILGFKF
ncbi:hypothetical protein [Psychroflexus tropicus]|uniref:hypothetical protein n=1 Tax=Psychroflexus tropicus TaxID=197345 RepID=UPI00038217E8|nr:hypothetical protein [Psychroflexus tropicus]